MKETNNTLNNALQTIQIELRNNNYSKPRVLMTLCASLCNVDEVDMLTPTNNFEMCQARWFYWYACYKLCQDTPDSIARYIGHEGHGFSASGIRKGLIRMNDLIRNIYKWKARWQTLLNTYEAIGGEIPLSPKKEMHRIVITMPKELEKNTEITIKYE